MNWLPGFTIPASDSEMGHFRVGVQVGHQSGGRLVAVLALVKGSREQGAGSREQRAVQSGLSEQSE